MTKTWKKHAAGLLSCVVAFTALVSALPFCEPTQEAFAADGCLIDANVEHQTIRGFGGINLPEWTGQDMTAAQRETAFGDGDGQLGMTVLRVFVNDDKSQWSKAVPTAKAAIAKGAVVFASPWNPPADMAEYFDKDNNASTGTNGKEAKRLRHDKYAEYAQHLNDFVHFMKDNGVDLYSISIQNEPDYGKDWTWWTSDECVDFLANYASVIDCRVMSPETFQYNKSYYNAILGNSKAYANTDLFGTHFYGTSRNNMDFSALEQCGKEIWMTEVYVPNSEANSNDRWPEAIQVAENMHNGLVVGNLNAYVWWYIRRNYGPMKEDGTISKRGYCMSQYSRFVRPGAVRVEATESPAKDVYISAYTQEDEMVVVAVNKSTTGYSQQFTFANATIGEVDRYRTSASENVALTQNLDASENGFWAQLPAESVSTFVVSLTGEGPDDGYLFHDTFDGSTYSWVGRGSATVMTSGAQAYAGTESLLVQDRESAWNGAAKTLRASQFAAGKSYSFSVCAKYVQGGATDNLCLKLQYVGSDGETHYSSIAEATAPKGEWVQLANTDYQIPADATQAQIYVETADSTNNFYIDEAIAADAGTVIPGPVAVHVLPGDVNCDGLINALDLAALKNGIFYGFADSYASLAADVDASETVDQTDVALLAQYLVRAITEFPQSAPVLTNQWDSYQETASAPMLRFYQNAIYQLGNTSRLNEKIQQAQKGDPVTVAYLGGSITEGGGLDTCYAHRSYEYFAKTFGTGSNVSYINAGLSGTSSAVGILRADAEVLNKNADVIFLEFSVNDHPEDIYKKSFESLVKKCLSQPNDPAVILLINRAKGGYSMQEQMAAIGKNYDVPVISMDNALTQAFADNTLTTADYYTDEYHPHADGNALISDCIAYFYRQALKTENQSGAYTIPTKTVYGTEYSTVTIAPLTSLSGLQNGSFPSAATNSRFAYGFRHAANSGNTPLTFTTTGKGIFLLFRSKGLTDTTVGTVNVTTNGTKTTIAGNRNYAWGGADAAVAYTQNTSGTLEVSISMADPSKEFEIWGIGVIS